MIASTESRALLTQEPVSGVSTGAARDDSLASDPISIVSNRDVWQQVIDEKFVEWGRNPELLAEDDLIQPTKLAIDRAVKIALVLRDADETPPPLRVVPDGDGGIVLERWQGVITESIEINQHGAVEYVKCRNGHVEQRRPWPTE